MITAAPFATGAIPARSLRLFSNATRCEGCRRTTEIRVHYCPGCPAISGEHVHRWCRCDATWAERLAGHGGFVDLDDPAQVLVCQHCRSRIPVERALNPRCCRTPEVSYHDTSEPCELCRQESNPTPSDRGGRDA